MTWGTRAQSCETLKRENERLEYELQDARDREEERREREQRERDERRRERQVEYAESVCHADSWPEAFRKGIPRIAQEARDEESFYEEFPEKKGGFSFAKYLTEATRAEAVYNEVMTEAERRIEEIRRAALAEVADKLEAELGAGGLVEALREDNPEYLTYW